MKLLSAPSISSSSTTTSDLDVNMCTSKSTTAACLAGIFRLILCSHSLPTHPSDQITETSSTVFDNNNNNNNQRLPKSSEKIELISVATPGVVARLMGLESLPPSTSSLKFQVGNPSSISRSRSMNSLEFGEESHDKMPGQHRRVRSFREIPTFLEYEEFFVLSFENEDENKEFRSKGRNCEVGFGELREKRGKKCENRAAKVTLEKNEKEIKNRVLGRARLDLINHEEVCDERRLTMKKKINRFATNYEDPECSSEAASPVSVLDYGQFSNDRKVSTSEEGKISGETSNSRRKLSPDLENYEQSHLCQLTDNSLIHRNYKKKIEQTCGRSRKSGQDCVSNMWREICMLAEAQVTEPNMIYRTSCKLEHVEDVVAEIGQQILDQSLAELIEQLR